MSGDVKLVAEKELCFAEIKLLRGDCAVVWDNPDDNMSPRRSPFWVGALILLLVAVFSAVFALSVGEGLAFLIALGFSGGCMVCIPLTFFAYFLSVGKKKKFTKTADIYPARITHVRRSKKDFYDGDGFYYAHRVLVGYELFTPWDDVKKTYELKFETRSDDEPDSRTDLFAYYEAKKYCFMIYNPKKKKAYPVRLYDKAVLEAVTKAAVVSEEDTEQENASLVTAALKKNIEEALTVAMPIDDSGKTITVAPAGYKEKTEVVAAPPVTDINEVPVAIPETFVDEAVASVPIHETGTVVTTESEPFIDKTVTSAPISEREEVRTFVIPEINKEIKVPVPEGDEEVSLDDVPESDIEEVFAAMLKSDE